VSVLRHTAAVNRQYFVVEL